VCYVLIFRSFQNMVLNCNEDICKFIDYIKKSFTVFEMNMKSLFKFSSKGLSRLAVVLVISTLLYTTYFNFAMVYMSVSEIILYDFAERYLFFISVIVFNIIGVNLIVTFVLNYTSVLIVFFLVKSIDWVISGFRNQ